ncbi:G5 domain-containing protein [Romboutsia sp.]|uniref:G5 domain-containing protein n=1 Tax=Romboutsia sp. TaxID=1965302 RepID=UPI003F2E9FAB
MNNEENKRVSSILVVISLLIISLGTYCNLYKEQISLCIARKETKVSTFKKTVKELLDENNVKYDNDDKITPSLNAITKDGMKIKVIKVDVKEAKEYENIPFETNLIEDKNLIKGITKIEQDGKYGEKELLYKLVYEDDKLVDKKLIKEIICTEPTEKIIKKGTKEDFKLTSRGDISRVGKSEYMKVVATAYAGDTITSTGTAPKWGTIAIDPRIIPYGSKVYIPIFNMIFTAEDCGGAIKGNRIDIFMYSESQCNDWGRRSIDIYIVN